MPNFKKISNHNKSKSNPNQIDLVTSSQHKWFRHDLNHSVELFGLTGHWHYYCNKRLLAIWYRCWIGFVTVYQHNDVTISPNLTYLMCVFADCALDQAAEQCYYVDLHSADFLDASYNNFCNAQLNSQTKRSRFHHFLCHPCRCHTTDVWHTHVFMGRSTNMRYFHWLAGVNLPLLISHCLVVFGLPQRQSTTTFTPATAARVVI